MIGVSEFHPFSKSYYLLGAGLLFPCQITALEIEASIVPGWAISRGLFWGGIYGAVGLSLPRSPGDRAPSHPGRCFRSEDQKITPKISYPREGTSYDGDYLLDSHPVRWSGGLEGGWRMFGADIGYIHNEALIFDGKRGEFVDGVRFRVGLALAYEIFSAAHARYGLKCCKGKSETACECDRTESGVSLFIYYGNEFYWRGGRSYDDGMLGFTLKTGLGL